MPTSGLVLTARRPDDVGGVIAALAAESFVVVGAPAGARVPLVLDTPDKATDKRLWDWLNGLPGVASVDVAFIYLGEQEPTSPVLQETVP